MPLENAVKALKESRYQRQNDSDHYLDLVQDLATELAWHLDTIGVTWQAIADNATPYVEVFGQKLAKSNGSVLETALTGPIFDLRNAKYQEEN